MSNCNKIFSNLSQGMYLLSFYLNPSSIWFSNHEYLLHVLLCFYFLANKHRVIGRLSMSRSNFNIIFSDLSPGMYLLSFFLEQQIFTAFGILTRSTYYMSFYVFWFACQKNTEFCNFLSSSLLVGINWFWTSRYPRNLLLDTYNDNELINIPDLHVERILNCLWLLEMFKHYLDYRDDKISFSLLVKRRLNWALSWFCSYLCLVLTCTLCRIMRYLFCAISVCWFATSLWVFSKLREHQEVSLFIYITKCIYPIAKIILKYHFKNEDIANVIYVHWFQLRSIIYLKANYISLSFSKKLIFTFLCNRAKLLFIHTWMQPLSLKGFICTVYKNSEL